MTEAALQRAIPKRSKYGARRTELDGRTFHSKAEADYYAELKLRARAGEVREVECQVPYSLDAGGVKIGTYYADFTFYDNRLDRHRVVDVKGKDTPLSRWKRKHVAAQHGVDVEIVKA